MPSIFTRNIRFGALATAAAATVKFAYDGDDTKLKQKQFAVDNIGTRKIDPAKLQSAIQTATKAVNAFKVRGFLNNYKMANFSYSKNLIRFRNAKRYRESHWP
jgi:hypothetical protein